MKVKKQTSREPVVNIITMGCSKNTVDSEVLVRQLEAGNIQAFHESKGENFNIVIINTCGFINDAKQESIDMILKYIDAKAEGLIDKVFVMGCLSERYREELSKEIPEIDGYYGVSELPAILAALNVDYKKDLIGERVLSTPNHFAYFKISEGCEHKCSFCAIPLIRGKYESRSLESLVQETKNLSAKGVKELILIAQDLTWYGIDMYGKRKLADLLRNLSDVSGIEWIRLQYAYPQGFPEDVLDVMAERSNICKYLDIPFQHISDEMLRSMKRGIDSEGTYALIDKIRSKVPGIALRTSLIAGYPGERPKHFKELMKFVEKTRFERLGVFTYSEEENTAAALLKDDVGKKTKLKRVEELMSLQQGISLELNQAKIGKTYKVLVDALEDGCYTGRTEFDSPEVDNDVIINTKEKLKIGEFIDLKISGASEFELFGEM